MLDKAGISANKHRVPVVFDPVGAGASELRSSVAAKIMREIVIAVLRDNTSEIYCVAGVSSSTRGVDASSADIGMDMKNIALVLAGRYKCVVAVTGPADTVSDGVRTVEIRNGHPALTRVAGVGCMCSPLVGSFVGAMPGEPFKAAVAAVTCMGIAGEIAFEKAGERGAGSFRVALMDVISSMDDQTLSGKIRSPPSCQVLRCMVTLSVLALIINTIALMGGFYGKKAASWRYAGSGRVH